MAGQTGKELKRARGDRCGGRPQIRERHKRALTKGEIKIFLTTLSETCNVSAAARAAKRPARLFYDRRRRDAAFRALWMQTLREAYDHLELALVQRARFGAPKDIFHEGVKRATTRIYADGTSMRLLHLHRATIEAERKADEGGGRRDGATILAELVRRLNLVTSGTAGGGGDDGGR